MRRRNVEIALVLIAMLIGLGMAIWAFVGVLTETPESPVHCANYRSNCHVEVINP